MINENFDEFSWNDFESTFTKCFNEFMNEFSKNNVKKDDENVKDTHSYYHKVKDTYDYGKHTSHIEKEIKDGEVLKDIKQTFEIDDKCHCKNNDNKCCIDKKDDNTAKNETVAKDFEYYEKQLSLANDLLKQAQNTIELQQKEIEIYKNDCAKYEEKFTKIEKYLNSWDE